jgi:hypothetical protein
MPCVSAACDVEIDGKMRRADAATSIVNVAVGKISEATRNIPRRKPEARRLKVYWMV